jgi:hypothetical protein
MELKDIQGKRYAGFRRCIFCGSDGGNDGLRDEHIMPFCLGGNAVIEEASCTECERITSYLDGYLGRNTFFEYRIHADIQTRNPEERPKDLPAKFQVMGQIETRNFPAKEQPYILAMPIWGIPGFLRGAQPQSDFGEPIAHGFFYIPPALQNEFKERSITKLTMFSRMKPNTRTFARAIMKIAYCHAVAEMGLTGFRPLYSTAIILGRYPFIPYLVGCETTDPPPPSEGRLHTVNLSYVSAMRMKILMASVRLFANSGTLKHGMPIYRVVVGAPKLAKRTSS